MQTDEERAFSVAVDRNDWRVDLPVPPMPRPAGRRIRWPGTVVADVTVHREDVLPAGRLLAVPAIRRLAALLDDTSQNLERYQRPTGQGRAVAVQADAETVTVGLVSAAAMFERIFERSGWSLRQSDEGRFGTQLIERLGGAGAATASQPAVRAVLHTVSSASRAKPIPALIQSAETSRGEWPGPVSPLTAREYATRVVYSLLRSRLLQPVMSIRCPRCTTEVDLRPEDLVSDMRCALCGEEFPLGLALALSPGRGVSPWRSQLAANIPAARLRSTLPVMAALAVLYSHRAGSAPVLPYLLGLEVYEPGWACEIDIVAAVLDGPSTVAVIGEVKGGRDPIDENDLNNLTRVQGGLRDAGIETLILAATTREDLAPEEHAALRALCERAPEWLHAGGAAVPALPLVLLGADLSRPWLSEDHPWRWGQPGSPPLSEMALESCRRNLGFVDVELEQVAGGWRPRLHWRGDAVAPPGG